MTLQEVIKELQEAPPYKYAELARSEGFGFFLHYCWKANETRVHTLNHVVSHPSRSLGDGTNYKQIRYLAEPKSFTDRDVLSDAWQIVGEETDEILIKVCENGYDE